MVSRLVKVLGCESIMFGISEPACCFPGLDPRAASLPRSVSEGGEMAGWFDGIYGDAEVCSCQIEVSAVAIVEEGEFDLGRLGYSVPPIAG